MSQKWHFVIQVQALADKIIMASKTRNSHIHAGFEQTNGTHGHGSDYQTFSWLGHQTVNMIFCCFDTTRQVDYMATYLETTRKKMMSNLKFTAFFTADHISVLLSWLTSALQWSIRLVKTLEIHRDVYVYGKKQIFLQIVKRFCIFFLIFARPLYDILLETSFLWLNRYHKG